MNSELLPPRLTHLGNVKDPFAPAVSSSLSLQENLNVRSIIAVSRCSSLHITIGKHKKRHCGMTMMLLLLLFLLPFSVSAWGKVGHEMVANLAYHRLSDESQQTVIRILGTNNSTFGSPLAAVADWADRVRYTKTYHWTTPLHFIDVHDADIPGACPSQKPNGTTLCTFDYQRDCEEDMCVAGAIANYSSHLALGASRLGGDSWRLKESLMFVTHFVGDIHQPLHCARKSDKGGNSFHVQFNLTDNVLLYGHKKGEWNLHSVWDDGIIDRALLELFNQTRETFEDDLLLLIHHAEANGEIDTWLSCPDGRNKTCTSLWAEESLNDALVWAYRNSDDTEIVDNSKLSTEYYESRLGVVQRRLAAAGVRLAATLELVLAGTISRKSFWELLFPFTDVL